MDLNERTIAEIANQLGLGKGRGINSSAINNLSSKSDVELEREILKLKEQLKANNISLEQQMTIIKKIAPMMDKKQRERLNKVVEILRK